MGKSSKYGLAVAWAGSRPAHFRRGFAFGRHYDPEAPAMPSAGVTGGPHFPKFLPNLVYAFAKPFCRRIKGMIMLK
jgi:hypothetical protein